jgi:hypothetical protein
MSDKPWDADAELGTGRTLDFGDKPEDLGEPSLKLPESPEFSAEAPVPAEQRRREGPRIRLSWIIWLVILTALAGPLFGVVVSLITAIDDISDAVDSFEDTKEIPTATENFGFLRTLDAAVSGTANALPQCFFDEASSLACTSTYDALANLVDSTSVTIDCSGYRAFWVNSLRRAGDGDSANLQALYNDDAPAFPAGYAEARVRCVGSSQARNILLLGFRQCSASSSSRPIHRLSISRVS